MIVENYNWYIQISRYNYPINVPIISLFNSIVHKHNTIYNTT